MNKKFEKNQIVYVAMAHAVEKCIVVGTFTDIRTEPEDKIEVKDCESGVITIQYSEDVFETYEDAVPRHKILFDHLNSYLRRIGVAA